MTPCTLFQWEKKPLPWTGLWQLRNSIYTVSPLPGDSKLQQREGRQLGHRHLKIAATKTPEFKSTSSRCFQQKSSSKAQPSMWEMPNFSEGWWCTSDWWLWSQHLKISKVILLIVKTIKLLTCNFQAFLLIFFPMLRLWKIKLNFISAVRKPKCSKRAGAKTV